MRILALDIGSKRIGVSISDELGLTAQGMETIIRGRIDEDIEKIRQIVDAAQITEIIIGLPLSLNGSKGRQAQMALDFALLIRREFKVNVIVWDERFSTRAAERTLLEADLPRRRRKMLRDRVAATLILQGYLDSLSHSQSN